MVRNFFKKGRVLAAGVVLTLALTATAVTQFAAPSQSASADSDCSLNIVCNGLSGSNLSQNISSFQSLYNAGSDGHNSDLRAVWQNWMGATPAIVNGMNTSNTVLGTVHSNGVVEVNGRTVGTGAIITARFHKAGFTQVEGNVWSRPVTTYEYYSTRPAIIYMQNGRMLFFVEIPCANAGKATPSAPEIGSLGCANNGLVLLAGDTDSKGNRTYTLQANALANNATITSYTFNFGAGQGSQVVRTNALTATSSPHVYPPGNYSADVVIDGVANSIFATAPGQFTCAAKIVSVPQPPAPATLVCSNLTLDKGILDKNTGDIAYKLTAQASVKNATITKYIFNFGDDANTTQTITTNALSATSQSFTYKAGKTYHLIYVTVNGTSNEGKALVAGGADSGCATNVKIPPQTCATGSSAPECKPVCTSPTNGKTYPVGSPECQPVPPVTPPTTPPAEKLADTGPGGIIGLFLGTSILGAVAHNLVLKRRAFSRL